MVWGDCLQFADHWVKGFPKDTCVPEEEGSLVKERWALPSF